MRGDPGADDLSHLLELAGRPADQVIAADVPQELTTRLLGAARARVTGVDIDVTEADAAELSPAVTVARIGLAGPAGTRQVTADLGLGLALAVAAGAPVRLADAVMDRLAVPVPGDDLLTPFLDRVPPVARAAPGHGLPGWPMATLPGRRPRYEPRNLDFAAGLDRWDLDAGPVPAPDCGLGAGLRGRRRGRLRGPVILRPAARRVRRPGPGHLRRRLPRCHRHLQRRDSRRSAHRTGRAPPGDHPALVARGTGPRGPWRDHIRSPPLDQVRDHGADTCGRRPDPVRHRADRHRPDRTAEPRPAR